MESIEELLRYATNIGEVITDSGGYQSHHGLLTMAQQLGIPTHDITLPLDEAARAVSIETEAARQVPGLAAWVVRHNIDMVLSPEYLSRQRMHRVAGRATMLAVMRVVAAVNREVSIVIGHGPDIVQGTWMVNGSSGSAPTAPVTMVEPGGDTLTVDCPVATSYSCLRIRPGIISGLSVELGFAVVQSNE